MEPKLQIIETKGRIGLDTCIYILLVPITTLFDEINILFEYALNQKEKVKLFFSIC